MATVSIHPGATVGGSDVEIPMSTRMLLRLEYWLIPMHRCVSVDIDACTPYREDPCLLELVNM